VKRLKVRKHLKDCKKGDIIAEDIYLPGRNIPIEVKGNIIDNKLIDRLIENRVLKILMMAIGNGKFSGGGFKGLPEALVDDGIMDISIVKNVSRREFISLIGPYKKGTHLSTKLGQKIVTYEKCKSITVKDEKAFSICIDGEVDKGNILRVEVEKNAILFSVPQ